MSAREAGFNLRESWPLTRQALQNQGRKVVDNRVSERSTEEEPSPVLTEAGDFPLPAQRIHQVKLESGRQRPCTLMTFGIPQSEEWVVRQTATYGVLQSPIMRTWEAASGMRRGVVLQSPKRRAVSNDQALCTGSVGVAIVLGAWESQGHGEGPQSGGTSVAKVTECKHEGGSSCGCR